MSYTVIGAPLSPFVRKVHLTMQLKGLDYDMEPVSPFALPEGYEEINPLKRIPVLKHGDDYICDSSVICQYLEDLHPEPALIPKSPLLRARVAWYEKIGDTELAPTITFAAFRHRVIYRAMGTPYDEAEVAALIAEKAPPLYDYLDNTIGDQDYLVDGRLTLADIAIVTQLINASLGDERADAQRWSNLARYTDFHFASEVFAPTIEKARTMVGKMLARVG